MLQKCCEIFILLNFAVLCNFSTLNRETKHKTDIINTISSANEVIQELIDNYEKIQNNRQEDVTKNVGKLKILLYDKGNKNHRNRAYYKPENLSLSTHRPGTVGIYESRSLESDIIKNIDVTYPKRVKMNYEPKNNIYNKKNKKHKEINNEEIDAEISDDSEDIEEISIEIPLKSNEEENNSKILKSYSKPKVIQNLLGEKTRFSIKSFNRLNKTKNPLLRIFEFPFKINRNSRRVKKIVYSEKFSPNNIWQEIISKPISLSKDVDPFVKKDRNNDDDKVTIFIFKKHADKDSKEERSKYNSRDMALRNTYGLTCLQSPMKKCHKVITDVSQKTCRRFKCEPEFKAEFEKNGKSECDKIFLQILQTTTQATTQQKIEPIDPDKPKRNDSIFSRHRKDRESNFHKELVKYKVRNLRNDRQLPNHKTLRDKYEAECQKESREKCIKACENAVEKSCKTSDYVCSNAKERGFKDSCKEECRRIFFVERPLGSSSDYSDSSDDNSESDSNSNSNSS